MRLPALFALLVGAATVSAWAQDATAVLRVHVSNISTKGGNLRLSLYDETNYRGNDGESTVDVIVPATAPEMDITVPAVPPGIYAVKMFQDYNRNGEFDFTWLGLPAERYGFSNNAQPFFSEPDFDRVKIDLKAGVQDVSVTLQ